MLLSVKGAMENTRDMRELYFLKTCRIIDKLATGLGSTGTWS
jgi:hypothetical protein